MQSLREQAKQLPQSTGVYRFDDASGRAIYIGKAINIRRRVAQHLDKPMRSGLLNGAVSVEAFETPDENTALSLERELIRRYKPRRNIRLPGRPLMLCVTDDPYPRLVLTRMPPEKGWRAFGPYESAGAARRLLETLESTFQIRSCQGAKPGRPQTPCLDYYMGRCSAPCADKVSQEEYREQIEAALKVLRGNHEKLSSELEEAMAESAKRQDYERAALLRDRISSLSELTGAQYSVGGGSYDVIAVACEENQGCVELRRIRSDQLVDVTRHRLEFDEQLNREEILRQFILDHAGELDSLVVMESSPEDQEEIRAWRNRNIKFQVPSKGGKKEALSSATLSAERALKRPGAEPESNPLDALEELKELLDLEGLPLQIECVDISNLGARQTIGGIVHLEAGKNFDSRALNLEPRSKPNDVASIGELLERRKTMAGWRERPDLMIIDGGVGQLNRATRVLEEWINSGMAIAALAKKEELLFIPGKRQPLRPQGKALHLLQKLRDRTHNTAISAHRRRRDRESFSSPLDNVKGIGPARRKALINRFGSLDAVLEASQEELESVIPREVASRLKRSTD